MNQDRDYIALVQIQRSMQNEISSLSLGNTRLTDYIRSMKSSNLSMNGTLKAMELLAGMDEKRKDRKSAAAVRAWMNELIRFHNRPLLGMLVENMTLSPSVSPEFLGRTSISQRRILRIVSRQTWLMVLGAALVLGGLLALFVLVFHFDFYWMLILGLILYFLFAAYTFLWLARRSEIRLFKELTLKMSPESKSFVRSIRIENLSALPDWMSIHQTIAVWNKERRLRQDETRKIRRMEKEKTAAERAQKKRLARMEKQTVHQTTVRTRKSQKQQVKSAVRNEKPMPFAPDSILAVTYDFENAPVVDASSLFEPSSSYAGSFAKASCVDIEVDETEEETIQTVPRPQNPASAKTAVRKFQIPTI